LFSLKSIATAATLAVTAVAASPADAWTLINWSGSPGVPVWGEPWPNPTTISNSPLRWTQESENVWYRVYFEGRTDSHPNGLPGLASSLLFRLNDISADGLSWTFGYELVNASNDVGANLVTSSRVSSFSFDVDPDEAARALTPGGFFTVIQSDVNMQAGSTVGVQDICIKSTTQTNCQGNGGTGVWQGQTGSGGFILSFTTAPTQLVFTDPMVRYQSISRQDIGGDFSGTGIPVAWVPEPSTWAMMIIGFGGAGAVLRRRRRLLAAA
jgi:hypothetical protein